MGEIVDKVKGKAKQIEGILTGNEALKREGEIDEVKGKVKELINKVGDAATKGVTVVKQAVKKI